MKLIIGAILVAASALSILALSVASQAGTKANAVGELTKASNSQIRSEIDQIKSNIVGIRLTHDNEKKALDEIKKALLTLEAKVDAIKPCKCTAVKAKPVADKPKILMYSSKSCPPCKQWIANELQKVKDAKWTVEIIEASSGVTPTFKVTGLGKSFEHVGYLDMATLTEFANQMKR